MSQSVTDTKLRIPEATKAKLDAFRKRVWLVKVAEGLFAAACGLLLSYLFVFVLDRMFDTPWWLRAALLLGGAAVLGVWFPIKCHRWIWQTRRFDQLARLLKHRMPRLSDRMLGIIELADSAIEQQRSAALCSAALRQVDHDIRDTTFDDAVPNPRHVAWGWAAAAPFAVATMALLVVPAAGTNALVRWLMPWKQTDRYTFAQLAALPDEIVVPYAEPFPLTTALLPDSAWKPAAATARIDEQPAIEANRVDERYEFEFPAQKEHGHLRLAVGDARKTVAFEPKTRPELTSVVATIKLPAYLQYQDELVKDVRGGEVSIVKGSEASFQATASRELRTAALNGVAQDIVAKTIMTSATPIHASTTATFIWEDAFGLTAKQPFELTIQASDDQAPSIYCTALDQQTVILHDEVLKFQLAADDDFGLKQIGIAWQGIEDPLTNPNPIVGETLITAGGPEQREIQAEATFCASREGIEPQTLQLRLFAVDYLPGRERTYSTEYILHVLSAEDHAIWLTNQLRRWSRQAQAIYERENQLFENNKALRQLTPAELNTEKNRQRLQTQAAAEKENGRRLTEATAAGELILREAARNDQFNAMTMEHLASMLNTLDEIAKNRMPSVADLLAQAATAPARSDSQAGQPGPPSQGPPKPTGPQVGNNRDPQAAEGGPSEPGDEASDDKPLPTITDAESNMNSPDKQEPPGDQEPQAGKGGGKFGLPTTTVVGGGAPDQPQEEPAESPPPDEKLDEAIQEQEDLLGEFAKVADELQRILDNLEGSTFVKRLKAASRRQLKIANELNDSLAESFGKTVETVAIPVRQKSVSIADREVAESDNLFVVQQDLEAYYNRVQQGKFLTVIQEMIEMGVTAKLRELASMVTENMHGRSIAHAEYWADTLDRWAEQLVGPGSPSGASEPASKGNSLPPAIVLDVMRILEKEIGLRDETRAAELAREAVGSDAYTRRANRLSESQRANADSTAEVLRKIEELATEGLDFPQESSMLTRVEEVMLEATLLLARPDTGPEPIAAETEAIELLLQAQRVKPPKGSGGGSGSNPGAGSTGDTEESALALLGRGDEQNASAQSRETTQATGTSGGQFPAEFRVGLDTYFSELEK